MLLKFERYPNGIIYLNSKDVSMVRKYNEFNNVCEILLNCGLLYTVLGMYYEVAEAINAHN